MSVENVEMGYWFKVVLWRVEWVEVEDDVAQVSEEGDDGSMHEGPESQEAEASV